MLIFPEQTLNNYSAKVQCVNRSAVILGAPSICYRIPSGIYSCEYLISFRSTLTSENIKLLFNIYDSEDGKFMFISRNPFNSTNKKNDSVARTGTSSFT